jgi:hypothetical protein
MTHFGFGYAASAKCRLITSDDNVALRALIRPVYVEYFLSSCCKQPGSMGESRTSAVFNYRFPHVRRLSFIAQ